MVPNPDSLEPQVFGSFVRVLNDVDVALEPSNVAYIALHSIMRLVVRDASVWAETSDDRIFLIAGRYKNDFEANEARHSMLLVLTGENHNNL
ncbi:hypothetical protein CJO09_00955 [Neopusillimonas maritima]|uniref:Uncharacterized protein n=1 Tax=Neopusillimonas maritima TaxID=2026239 RepID=A0ABX9MYC5_9BURK|nr:hypothetical protein CJO09_00955 [Neopusillimonas maritima]